MLWANHHFSFWSALSKTPSSTFNLHLSYVDVDLCFALRIRLRPRILRDVSVSDTRTTVQGTEISFPVGIAPTAFHCLAWHEGEMATARGEEMWRSVYMFHYRLAPLMFNLLLLWLNVFLNGSVLIRYSMMTLFDDSVFFESNNNASLQNQH